MPHTPYLYDEVTVRFCPLKSEVIPFALIDMDGWKLVALSDIQIMSSDKSTNRVKEKVKSIITADSRVAAQAIN